MEPIASSVVQIIAEHLGKKPLNVRMDSRLVDDLGADDLDLIEFTMALEERWNIIIEDGDVDDAFTVADFVSIVRNRI